jgi:hypothetical protein
MNRYLWCDNYKKPLLMVEDSATSMTEFFELQANQLNIVINDEDEWMGLNDRHL